MDSSNITRRQGLNTPQHPWTPIDTLAKPLSQRGHLQTTLSGSASPHAAMPPGCIQFGSRDMEAAELLCYILLTSAVLCPADAKLVHQAAAWRSHHESGVRGPISYGSRTPPILPKLSTPKPWMLCAYASWKVLPTMRAEFAGRSLASSSQGNDSRHAPGRRLPETSP